MVLCRLVTYPAARPMALAATIRSTTRASSTPDGRRNGSRHGDRTPRRSSTTKRAEPRPAPPHGVVRHVAWKAAISTALERRSAVHRRTVATFHALIDPAEQILALRRELLIPLFNNLFDLAGLHVATQFSVNDSRMHSGGAYASLPRATQSG